MVMLVLARSGQLETVVATANAAGFEDATMFQSKSLRTARPIDQARLPDFWLANTTDC
jgi:hypothetical protein